VAELGSPARDADAATALALVSAVAGQMGLELVRRAAQPPGYHPTRTASLELDRVPIGFAGELHPVTGAGFEIESRVAIAEIELAPLVAVQPRVNMLPISTYPHVDFDLSFEIPRGLEGSDLVAATAEASDLLEEVMVFDDFVHPESAERSIAIRYRLRAGDRTLSRNEIEAERVALVNAAASLGARLRGD
jgi:phenylalanyl-tRNA synthetase beta chain